MTATPTTPAPVSQRRIDIAKESGLLDPSNVDAIALACRLADVSFAVACAGAEQESNGRHTWGAADASPYAALHDLRIPVTRATFWPYYLGVLAGHVPTGVGIMQITYAGRLQHRSDGTPYRSGGRYKEMLDRDYRPWNEVDNVRYGCEELRKLRESLGSWRDAAAVYNGGSKDPDYEYADEFEAKRHAWLDRF